MDKIKFLWKLTLAFAALSSRFLTLGYAMDVTLSWDIDSTVDGYKIYYRAGSSGPPYNGTGAAEGDSPVNVGWVSEFTLRALSDDDYHFVVTAYLKDVESGYSNEVTNSPSSAVATGWEVSDYGGSEGGCFISTIRSK